MLKMKNKISVIFFIILFAWIGMGIRQSFAQGIVIFGPHETKLLGSIPYTLIGKYKAQFRDFKGRIVLDEKSYKIQSVYLEISVNSITSNCPWCDKLAKSRRLLNAARYPKIIFKSDQIAPDEEGYKVKGVLVMHGIRRKMTFPFKVDTILDQRTKRKLLILKGIWNINRKKFNIIWNKYLDRGGVLVGNNFTVDWSIRVSVNP